MKSSAYKPWLVGVAVFAAVVWFMRPPKPRFLRLPARGPAPAWRFSDIDGKPWSATNFSGQIVVLNFWATWCPPCVRELPELAAFHLHHTNQGVTVIGASIDEPAESALRNFLRRSPPPYPIVVADPPMRDAFGGVSQVPETWVLDRQGQVAARYLGPLSEDELNRAVAPILARDGPNPAAVH